MNNNELYSYSFHYIVYTLYTHKIHKSVNDMTANILNRKLFIVKAPICEQIFIGSYEFVNTLKLSKDFLTFEILAV